MEVTHLSTVNEARAQIEIQIGRVSPEEMQSAMMKVLPDFSNRPDHRLTRREIRIVREAIENNRREEASDNKI